jgi:hypothetical protein
LKLWCFLLANSFRLVSCFQNRTSLKEFGHHKGIRILKKIDLPEKTCQIYVPCLGVLFLRVNDEEKKNFCDVDPRRNN